MLASDAAAPVCLTHADRPGLPCPRCGTFGCSECLSAGVCASCQASNASRPPMAEEVYGFGRRAGGRIIDMVAHQFIAIVTGVFAGVTIAILERLGIARAGAVQGMADHSFFFNALSGNLAAFLGATVSTAISGVTIGKAILGMRVVSIDGGRPSFGGVVLRELGYFIDVFFFGLIGKAAMDGSSLAQRHGDRWGRTTVVQSAAATGTARASTARLVFGLFAGVVAYALCLGSLFVVSAL